MSAQRASAGVMEAWASTMASAEAAALCRPSAMMRSWPSASPATSRARGLGEDDRVDLHLLAGAARGVGDQIGGGPDGGGERRCHDDAPAGLHRRLGHGPVDPEDRHVRLRRRVVGAGADGGAGAEHERGALGRLQQRVACPRPDLVSQRALVDRVRQQRRLDHVAHRDAGIDLVAQLVEQVDQSRHRVDHDQLAASAAHRPLLRDPAPCPEKSPTLRDRGGPAPSSPRPSPPRGEERERNPVPPAYPLRPSGGKRDRVRWVSPEPTRSGSIASCSSR